MPRSRLYFAATVAGLVACGGIADPTAEQHQTATISGALTTSGGATLPSNAHVALVWRVGDAHTFAVGSDAAIVAGHFSLNVDTPPDAYFFSGDDQVSSDVSGSGAVPPTPRTDTSVPSTGSGSGGTGGGTGTGGTFAKSLSPLDVSGQITSGLEVAVAGFVVYADTNGNGQLDITSDTATPTDEILGGSSELFLTYLKGGGALDYEKLRDKSGILPAAGFNLAWTEGRWLPLDEVELKLKANTTLPGTVCSGSGGTYASGGSGGAATTGNAPSPAPRELDGGAAPDPDDAGLVDATTDAGYEFPSPNDPTLQCGPDGRSYSVTPTCPPPPPSPPRGLCTLGDEEDMACAGGGGMSLAPGQDPPPGWPCPIAVDAGPPEDGGPLVTDAAIAD